MKASLNPDSEILNYLFIHPASSGLSKNELQNHAAHFLEFPQNYFADLRKLHSPATRILAVREFIKPQQCIIAQTALWIYTGYYCKTTFLPLRLANIHANASSSVKRRRYSTTEVQNIAGSIITTPERTALDLLLADIPSGIGYLCKLLRSGADFSQVLQQAQNLRGVKSSAQVVNVLQQIRTSICPQN